MNLSSHLFVSCDGSLSDTRKPGWSTRPLRPLYSRHCRKISTGAELRACLRAGEWTWPGGYSGFFVTSDGGTLSFDTVRKELRSIIWSIRHKARDGWRIIGMDTVANCDEEVFCSHTGKEIS